MITIKAKKQELVNVLNGLFQVQEIQGKKFSLVVSKNIDILKTELASIEKAATPSEEFMKLAKEVNELSKIEGADGNLKNQEKIDQLEEENKELVEQRQAQMETVKKMMDEETKVKLNPIDEEILPDTVTAKQINGIIKLIK